MLIIWKLCRTLQHGCGYKWLHKIHTMATIKKKYLWSQFLSQPSILEVIMWTKKGRVLWCWESISIMSISRSDQRESLFWSLFGILTKNASKVEQLKYWGRIYNLIISVMGCSISSTVWSFQMICVWNESKKSF